MVLTPRHGTIGIGRSLLALVLTTLVVGASLTGPMAASSATGTADGDPETVEFPIDVPGDGLDGGLVTDGTDFYAVVDSDDGEEIVQIDPETEEVIDRYEMPQDRASGLAIGDGALWTVDDTSDQVARIDLETGDAQIVFEATGAPAGITYFDGSLWIGDLAADEVFKYSPEGEYQDQFSLEEHTSSVVSLTHTDDDLWVGDAADDADPTAVESSRTADGFPSLLRVTPDGTVQNSTHIKVRPDAIATSRFGLLVPTSDGDIQVAIDIASPVADAGRDQTVTEGTFTELDATDSHDSVAADLSYNWTQIEGPEVVLRNESTATPEFVTPEVSENRTLRFLVNVSDGNGNFDTDTTNVTTIDIGQTGTRSDDGDAFTGGQTNRIDLSVSSDVQTRVRDVIPAEWTVHRNVSDDVERVVTTDGRKYVYFEETAKSETTYTYYVEAPEGTTETGTYQFGPAEVTPIDLRGSGVWHDVEGTDDTNVVVGASTGS